jgi:TonB family protein
MTRSNHSPHLVPPGEKNTATPRTFAPATSASASLLPSSSAPASATLGVLRPGHGVIEPRVIYTVDPQFTDQAKAKRIDGVCILSLVVDKNGFPQHIQVLKSLDPGLDRNAMAALAQYRFQPATFQGAPVAVQAAIEVNFKIF